MKKLLSLILILILLIVPEVVFTQSVEYFVKASFIEKFARFTEWKSSNMGDYFVIGVLGKSPFYNELELLAKKATIKNKSIKIKYITDYHEISNCQLLFVCSSEKENISKIVNYANTYNILIVGDTPGYGEKGVHFNFYFKNSETIHFEINLNALHRSDFKTDLQLLSIGKIINKD